jgi:hypothetical protein
MDGASAAIHHDRRVEQLIALVENNVVVLIEYLPMAFGRKYVSTSCPSNPEPPNVTMVFQYWAAFAESAAF